MNKKLTVQQIYNPEYAGPDATPNVEMHVYRIDQVINSITPAIGKILTAQTLDGYCEAEDWTVTVK